MADSINRRRVMAGALAGAGILAAGASPRFAARAATGPIASQSLGPSLTLFQGAGCNVVLAGGDAGTVMVDSGLAERAEDLSHAVQAQTGAAAPDILFNTSWRPDHTGGNDLFAAKGAQIVAHENTRLWMGTEFYVQWEDRTYPPRPAAAQPDRTFYTKDDMRLGDETVAYGHLAEAHTDGDIYVQFRKANVVAAGDALWAGRYPVMDYSTGGWLGGLAAASETLLEISDDRTLFVPGAGPVLRRAHVQRQYDMASTLRDRMIAGMREGKSARDMLDDGVSAEFDAEWGDPTTFIIDAYRGLWGHFRDLGVS